MRLLSLTALLALLLSAPGTAAGPEPGKKLYEAVLVLDGAGVKSLLAKGADANHVEGNRSVLGWAAQNGNVEIVKALLAAGANPNFVDGVGHTPLMRAIDTLQVPVVDVLLKARPDLRIRDRNGRTVAMLAVDSGKARIVRALLDAGADFNLADPDGNSPALLAAQGQGEEMYEMIALLGARKVNLNQSNAAYTPLYYAIQQENARLVAALLKAGADPNAATQSGALPLEAALSERHADLRILKLLIAAKADPNAMVDVGLGRGRPVIFVALEARSTGPLEALIKAGADLNRKDSGGRTPLSYARDMHLSEMAETLKRHGAVDPAAAAPAAAAEKSAPAAPPRNEYDALPKLRMVQALGGADSSVVYFSGAAVKELVSFYRTELPKHGWKAGTMEGDDQNYARMNFNRGGERMSVSLSRETGRTPPRVMVDLVPHGALSVATLPRYAGSTPLFEQDAIAIYVTADAMPKVAADTAGMLQGAGWQGGLTAQTPQMRHLTFTRDGNELTVQVSVAPAQGNKTTIQYSLRKR